MPESGIEVAARDEVSENVKTKVDTTKCMISLIWHVIGIKFELDCAT
jgi:hypothetical protein